MQKIFKWLAYGAVGLIGFLVLVIAGAYIIYPAEYVTRVLRWQDADVHDYLKFPEAVVANTPPVYEFQQEQDEVLVADLFETALAVDDFETFLEDTGTQAFIVIQDDVILYEEYFNGYRRDSIVTSFSMAKSFVSTLAGIAIEEGYIQSVDDPITAYLPELIERDEQFANITIGDLLYMSSGIHYVETGFLNGDDAKTYYYPDLRTLALDETRIDGLPGEEFLYNNYHPLLMGLILERATGMSVAEYLQEKVWKPLGMEYPASWSLDSEATQFEKMESGINARSIDFAKFGRLFLNNGAWEGRQVVPTNWVAQATQRDASLDKENYYDDDFIFKDGRGYYQYFWWGLTVDEQNYDFTALGNHGQFIYVSPEKDLIIVRNGERYGVNSLTWVDAFYDFARAIPGKSMNTKIAFATYAKLDKIGPDDQPAADALQKLGYTVEAAVWNAPDIDWGAYKAVVIRSCWDYHLHPQQFVEWLQRLNGLGIRVLNPPDVLRWNMDKGYLLDLGDQGIYVTPTLRLPKGGKVELAHVLQTKDWERAVVKPLISASAHQTWLTNGNSEEDQRTLADMLAHGPVLVQSFIPEIQTKGELSLLFFDKHYSHTVVKRPQDGDFRAQAEFGGSTESIQLDDNLIAQAQQVVDAIEAQLAYTRVDAVEVDGRLMLMELELIEPYLFLSEDPQAAQRFADAIHKQITNTH